MKVLIVDDEYSVLEALREYLGLRGYEVVVAARGDEALTVIQQERPNIMLLDIRLPGLSGMDVLRQVRQTDPKLQVIMITALDDAGLRREALQLGATAFAFKPLDVQGLERIISTALNQPPPLAPKSPFKSSEVTVLVVDDEPEICVALRYYLVGLGYRVLTAPTGAEALNQLRTAHPRPDIMLLDLTMPHKGGFTVLDEVKRMGLRLPIVVLSGNDADLVQSATKVMGVRRFLQKPVPLPAVERTLREVLAEGPLLDPAA
ncbi:MAG: response regulator [Candidatus Omnitrophica bacterium]|nr:response regulator [Candidatus Omnitrophota bacterium]